jgi:Fe-S-cluster-containing dehydrogenase component/anaerobic selenocysteine-containing dehydrogenase
MANDSTYRKDYRESTDGTSERGRNEDEFAGGVTDDFNLSDLSGMSRKQFLALLAASAAFAAAGCSDYPDKGEIVPYDKKPEEVTPGIPNFYASTCTGCPQACGILIKTREGRPIKIDGNPDHPINRGKICARGQASILNLYDPNRLRAPHFGTASKRAGTAHWNDADAEIIRALEDAAAAGKEIAIMTRDITSPTTKKILDDFKAKYRTTTVYSYSLFNDETRKRAWQDCTGSVDIPVIQWEKAKVILALESDFLGTDGMTMEQIRTFTDGRDVMKSTEFNRLYCIEGSMSLTGANADVRLRLRPDAQIGFVLALARELGGEIPGAIPLKEFAAQHNLSADVLARLVDDLRNHRGESLVHAGPVLPRAVHAAVNYLNEILGNTALYSRDRVSVAHLPLAAPEEIDGLIERMKAGGVGAVIHFDSNPLYHLPGSYEYKRALASVPLSVSLVEADDETSKHCTVVLPINHEFESWGDHKIRTGLLSLQQPVIAPLYDTRQKEAILLAWMNGAGSYKDTLVHEYLMNRWQKEVYPALGLPIDFKTFWYSALHDGVIEFKERVRINAVLKNNVLASLATPAASGIAVVLTESAFLGDGSFANNGWLQELPHPVSKVVWDNYAAISAETARTVGVGENDLLEVALPQGAITVPVLIQPGQADDCISIMLGYGRTDAGPVGSEVGVNAIPLLSKQALTGERVFTGASVKRIEGEYKLVASQERHSLTDEFTKDLQFKRNIIREGTLQEFHGDPNFLHKEKVELFSIAKEVQYNGVKWAMAIDLNKCIGCSTCVAACNVENNIPIVGKEQAAIGRAMHWIRIDRYYSGTDAIPSVSYQPMLCQQCDNAPCENVCPVAATNHSPDGLNQMVYNRCVGTKYCSNNCPYKVRRFNFFNWRDNLHDGYYLQEPINLMENPEVTVRARGVMEKCTFCIQRIMAERQHAIEQGREVNGNNVKTACQEACPATAIVFGDMNDAKSEVSRYRAHKIGYYVLEEVNTRPNITYLAKLRNVDKA